MVLCDRYHNPWPVTLPHIHQHVGIAEFGELQAADALGSYGTVQITILQAVEAMQ